MFLVTCAIDKDSLSLMASRHFVRL